MRIVIDTNVIASAMFFGGKPRLLLEIAMSGKLEVYASEEIVVEYKETVEELQARYPGKPLHLPLGIMIAAMKLIAPVSHIHVCRDPDDDKFIDCALDGKCIGIKSIPIGSTSEYGEKVAKAYKRVKALATIIPVPVMGITKGYHRNLSGSRCS